MGKQIGGKDNRYSESGKFSNGVEGKMTDSSYNGTYCV